MGSTGRPLGDKQSWKQLLLGVLLLAVMGVLAFLLVRLVWQALNSASTQIAAAVIAVAGTVLVSVASLICAKYWERRRETEQEHRNRKIPVYEEFLPFWFKVLMADKPGMERVDEAEIIRFMSGFTQKIMVWGSDQVIKQYSVFYRIIRALPSKHPVEPAATVTALVELEKLILAIRSDTGHRNQGIQKGDLLSLFITDISQAIQEGAVKNT